MDEPCSVVACRKVGKNTVGHAPHDAIRASFRWAKNSHKFVAPMKRTERNPAARVHGE